MRLVPHHQPQVGAHRSLVLHAATATHHFASQGLIGRSVDCQCLHLVEDSGRVCARVVQRATRVQAGRQPPPFLQRRLHDGFRGVDNACGIRAVLLAMPEHADARDQLATLEADRAKANQQALSATIAGQPNGVRCVQQEVRVGLAEGLVEAPRQLLDARRVADAVDARAYMVAGAQFVPGRPEVVDGRRPPHCHGACLRGCDPPPTAGPSPKGPPAASRELPCDTKTEAFHYYYVFFF